MAFQTPWLRIVAALCVFAPIYKVIEFGVENRHFGITAIGVGCALFALFVLFIAWQDRNLDD